jgi:hypothetical protein
MAKTIKRKPAKKVKGPDWAALKATVLATPIDVLKKAIQVDGWTIYEPSKFTDAGLDASVVAAFSRNIKSDTRDPKSTIFGSQGQVIKELQGVYGLELLEFIARCFDVHSDKSGRGFRQGHLTEQLYAIWK